MYISYTCTTVLLLLVHVLQCTSAVSITCIAVHFFVVKVYYIQDVFDSSAQKSRQPLFSSPIHIPDDDVLSVVQSDIGESIIIALYVCVVNLECD